MQETRFYTGQLFAGRAYGPVAIGGAPYMFRDFDHWEKYRTSDLFQELSQGYDEATGTFSPAGDMATARSNAEIAVVQGQALILGGYDGAAEVDTVEVYDADAKAMSSTTYKLDTARNNFSATKLKDGRILVIGGFAGAASLDGLDGQPVASAEIFVRQ